MDRYVAAGESLQAALNAAVPGDTITLQAGSTFTGSFVLPKKTGTSWITIRSSLMSALPTASNRVHPSHARYMAKLMSPNASAALTAGPGAHHYRIMGIEFTSAPGVYSLGVVSIGTGSETEVTQFPYSIELDRVYIHGDPIKGGKRGVALNSRHTAIKNSYISDFKSTFQDSQAICGWNGPGSFQIVNNYLEASGENVMFGGATPRYPNAVPSDITLTKNHFSKPLSWRIGDPKYAGTPWVVKNLLELKNARRVTISGNAFEYSWAHAQIGFAIVFTVRTEGGQAPWTVVEDVTFMNNIVRHAGGGININARDTFGGITRRITVKNNLFEDIDENRWGGGGRFVQLLNGPPNVIIDHNTILQTGPITVFAGKPSTGFIYRNNISSAGDGMCGDGKGCGTSALAYWTPSAVIVKNVIAGAASTSYPVGNYFPGSLSQVRFVDSFQSDYALAADSPYRTLGTDGKNLGVDFAALTAATANVVGN